MGYRSDVALVLTAKGMQAMKTALAGLESSSNALVSNLLRYAKTHVVDPESKAEAYCWEEVKWSCDFPEVKFFENLLCKIEEEEYRFIRIGEDYDDTEVHGGFFENPFDIELARSITSSFNAA